MQASPGTTRLRRSAMPVVAAAIVLASGAGCGGSTDAVLSKAQYESRLNDPLAGLNRSFYDLGRAMGRADRSIPGTPASNAAFATAASSMADTSDELDAFADQLASSTPPPDAAQANSELVAGLRDVARYTRKYGDAIAKLDGNQATLLREWIDNEPSGAQMMQSAAEKIVARGYRFDYR